MYVFIKKWSWKNIFFSFRFSHFSFMPQKHVTHVSLRLCSNSWLKRCGRKEHINICYRHSPLEKIFTAGKKKCILGLGYQARKYDKDNPMFGSRYWTNDLNMDVDEAVQEQIWKSANDISVCNSRGETQFRQLYCYRLLPSLDINWIWTMHKFYPLCLEIHDPVYLLFGLPDTQLKWCFSVKGQWEPMAGQSVTRKRDVLMHPDVMENT